MWGDASWEKVRAERRAERRVAVLPCGAPWGAPCGAVWPCRCPGTW
eukprot:gene11827-biopygen2361